MDAESLCTSWRLQKEFDGALRIYKGTRVHEHNSSQITSMYCGHVTIEATLDEAIDLFRTDGTNARKTLHQLRFGHRQHNANNTTTLYNIVEALPVGDESVAVTWQPTSAARGLVTRVLLPPLDECVLESVKLASCPDLHDTLGFVRVQNHGSGVMLLESDARPGFVDAYSLDHRSLPRSRTDDMSGIVRRLLARATTSESIERIQSTLGHLGWYVHEVRLNQGTPLLLSGSNNNSNAPPLWASQCHQCRKRFPWLKWSHKVRCAKCGVVVCRRCYAHVTHLANDGVAAFRKVPVCEGKGSNLQLTGKLVCVDLRFFLANVKYPLTIER
ncbi:hypothetical protein DYB25_010215 [Aphanomyces astaci]|uniref:FYVE-type domain-containing protein n=1 Tax=Aphanomyces astaci TaxID=112090 RepID=A0A397E1D5_APHAT|nr:hypothetical protein DYB25_010215 [Aphanomyces astaci]RHY74735.1 hypothetical protein DYB38_013399 [Aphanomyces astaci]RHZ38837.1 hypothetical protein DYB26_012319 [Aphanomyces astaci]